MRPARATVRPKSPRPDAGHPSTPAGRQSRRVPPPRTVVPAATPVAVVRRLNKDVNDILREPATIERYRKLSFEVFQSTPEQFDAFTQSELKKWRDVVRVAGATLD